MANVVDPYTATPGAVIAAAELNARIAAIIAQVNGNIDAANIANATVSKAKLASDALQAFLQLSTAATRKVKWGSVAPGAWGNVAQRDTVIPHGMGLTPQIAFAIETPIATFTSGGVALPVMDSIAGLDGTNVTVRSRTGDAGQTNNANTIWWLAIG